MRLALILLVAGCFTWPSASLAQQDGRTPPRRFDAEWGYLTFSWVGRPSDSFAIGPEIGGGFLKQVVAEPSGDDITGLAHLGLTSTVRLSERLDGEVGIRTGLGELRSIACAGCPLSAYYGVALAVFAGSRTWRFGTRVLAGRIEDASLLTWSPLVVRVQF